MAYPKNKQMVGENVLIWKTLHFDAEKTEIYNKECKELPSLKPATVKMGTFPSWITDTGSRRRQALSAVYMPTLKMSMHPLTSRRQAIPASVPAEVLLQGRYDWE
ncbi:MULTISPECIES: hypothetical protein [Paenibacillus]|uniref:hypothetical protein n=1 Tax=Paenibacillus TaxID=44249 RepID=UPI0011A48A10|nr:MULTISPECIES: hypothetical protein [Paenibacillus]MBJ9991285.1 hypothetical protein [Paenibacillus sp. S28]